MQQLVVAACCAAILCGCQTTPAITGAKLLRYGVYRNNIIGYRTGPQTSEGRIAVIGDRTLLKPTDRVRATVNTTFGIEYTVTGFPSNADADVVVELRHPPIHNPHTGRTVAVERDPHHVLTGLPTYDDVTLDERWNLVPGDWTFRVLHGSQVLLEKTFHVVTRNTKA
jgi:hypothetical protein